MDNEAIKHLLVKYITGDADEIDAIKVKQWISAHPENELYFIELYEAWQNMLHLPSEITDHELAYKRFEAGINSELSTPASRHTNRWYAATAMVAVMVLVACFFITRLYSKVDALKEYEVVVNKGELKKIMLSDGTQVWINAGSTLKYNSDFGKETRTVYLDGEALFDIAAGHKNRPFIVHTSKYIIRDIGTRFNLKAYQTDSTFETTVIRGEVSVERNADGNHTETNRILIKPHQVLRILNQPDAIRHASQTTGKVEPSTADALNDIQIQQLADHQLKQYDGWTADELVFEDKSLGEIARVLERRYNVSIAIADASLAGINYTGSFKDISSIDKVLDIIQKNTPITYARKGNQIMITKTQ